MNPARELKKIAAELEGMKKKAQDFTLKGPQGVIIKVENFDPGMSATTTVSGLPKDLVDLAAQSLASGDPDLRDQVVSKLFPIMDSVFADEAQLENLISSQKFEQDYETAGEIEYDLMDRLTQKSVFHTATGDTIILEER